MLGRAVTGTAPHPPRTVLPAAERAERNRRIAESKAAGATWPEVAERCGVSEKTARRAAAEHAAVGVTRRDLDAGVDAEALVERVVRVHVLALDRLERLSAWADNDSARVGAARSLSTVSVALLDVLARLGLVGDPGMVRFRAEMQRAAVAVVSLADRHDIPWEEVDAALRAVRPPEAA